MDTNLKCTECGTEIEISQTSDYNIRMIHEDAIHPDSVYARRPLEWFVGRMVKMAFQSANSIVEHMWVAVTEVDGDDLVGILDSDPAYVENVALGDFVRLRRVQIEAVNLSCKEWMEEVELLRSKAEFSNRWLGQPDTSVLLRAFDERLTPRQALNRWRKFIPSATE